MLTATLMAVLGLVGCDDSSELRVAVQTSYSVDEISTMRIRVLGGGFAINRTVPFEGGYDEPTAVGAFAITDASYQVTVTLFSGVQSIVSEEQTVEVSGSTTAIFQFSAASVCSSDAECVASAACVQATCTSGTCTQTMDDSRCGPGEVCTAMGCVGTDAAVPPLDSGPSDAGRLPADSGSADSGPMDSGSADSGSMDTGSNDAGAPDAGGPTCDQLTSPDILFCDDFESGDFAAWNAVVNNPTITNQAYGGSSALSVSWASGEGQFVDIVNLPDITSGDLWVRAYVHLAGSSSFVTGALFATGHAVDPWPAASLTIVDGPRLRFHGEPSGQGFRGSSPLDPNRWNCVELHISVSDSNGGYEVFLDGALQGSLSGLNTVPGLNYSFLNVGIPWAEAGQPDYTVRYDDIVVSRSRVPCD